jgi:hypothetical protein
MMSSFQGWWLWWAPNTRIIFNLQQLEQSCRIAFSIGSPIRNCPLSGRVIQLKRWDVAHGYSSATETIVRASWTGSCAAEIALEGCLLTPSSLLWGCGVRAYVDENGQSGLAGSTAHRHPLWNIHRYIKCADEAAVYFCVILGLSLGCDIS